jgi:hypothetical protein
MPSPKPLTPLPRIAAPTAAEIAARSKPSPPAQALLKPSQTPAEYLQALEQNQHGHDAVNLLAHGLPERESTWWACQSSRTVDPSKQAKLLEPFLDLGKAVATGQNTW